MHALAVTWSNILQYKDYHKKMHVPMFGMGPIFMPWDEERAPPLIDVGIFECSFSSFPIVDDDVDINVDAAECEDPAMPEGLGA